MAWHKNSTGWWYQYGTNNDKAKTPKYYKSCWAKIKGKWYHFNSQGYMQTGWLKDKGNWYYLDSSGAMVTGWKKVGGTWYYLTGSGAMVTGWNKIKNVWYYFNENGAWLADTAAPNLKVTNMKISRSNDTWTGSWKTPSTITGGNDKGRVFQNLQSEWTLIVPDASNVKDKAANDISAAKKITLQTTQDSITYSGWTGKSGDWAKKKLSRQAFYPLTSTKVDSIKLSVRGINYLTKGVEQSISYGFALPDKPTIATEYDETTQIFKATIKANASSGNKDRYDTRYRVLVYINYGSYADTTTLRDWTNSTAAEITYSVDVDDFRHSTGIDFASGTIVKFIVEAYCRGIKGDNPASNKPVTANRTIAYPTRGEIKSITATSRKAVGLVVVDVDSPKYTTTSTLQRAKNIDPSITLPSGVPSESFSNVEGAINNANVEFFYDTWVDARSDEGKYTWYRMKNENCGFIQYSTPKRADKLFIPAPTAENDKCQILSITQTDSGKGAAILIGWKEDNKNTGTEISWSDDANSWESTKQPSTFEFTWQDATPKDKSYTGTATVYVNELDEGTTYYFKARRYLEGDTKTYSKYSARKSITPSVAPGSVTLFAPEYVLRGKDIELSWIFDSDMPQKKWSVHFDGKPKTNVVAGSNANSFVSIKPNRYGAKANQVSFYVSVSTGGDFTDSNVVTVGIYDAPTCKCAIKPTITAQPSSLEVYSDKPGCGVACTVKSTGIEYERPEGRASQLEGDVIYTDATPSTSLSWSYVNWSSTLLYQQLNSSTSTLNTALTQAQKALDKLTSSDAGYADAVKARDDAQAALTENKSGLARLTGKTYKATLPLGYDPDYIDNGTYMFECFTFDTSTGLSSDVATCSSAIKWAHQAVMPSDDITIEVDEQARSAKITLVPPRGAMQNSDVYDIYRKVSTGYERIGESLALNAVVVDRYVPFARDKELNYRVCLRTLNGDIAFTEYEYDFKLNSMRIDWLEDYVELPYDIVLQDDYEKDFEARGHIDGSVGGYYNNSVVKTGSYTSNTFQINNSAQLDTLRRLATYPGACFVRTKDGQAFQCNVNVSINQPYDRDVAEISLNLTEVTLTEDFKIGLSDIEGAVQDGA